MGQKIKPLLYRGGVRIPWRLQHYDVTPHYSSYFFKYLLLHELFDYFSKKTFIKIVFSEYFKNTTYYYSDIKFDDLKKKIKDFSLNDIYSSQLILLKFSQWQILYYKVLQLYIKKRKSKYILKFIRLKMLYNTWHRTKFF